MDFLPTIPMVISPLAAFGFLLILGALGGFLAHRIPVLPSITGFMVAGLLLGPSVAGVLTQEVLQESLVIVDIALGLILYRLGLSLDLKVLLRAPQLLVISIVESCLVFGIVLWVLMWASMSFELAALVAAICISSSPAVLLHVAHEVNASGEVTESTKSLVALNNMISFIVFSAVTPAVHLSDGAHWELVLARPVYRFVGSVVVGVVVGYVVSFFAHRTAKAAQYQLALVIGGVMVVLGLANMLVLSSLFAPLVLGMVVRSLEKDHLISQVEFGAAFELFFIILFVFAGANLHLTEIVYFYPMILAVVLARSGAKLFALVGSSLVSGRGVRGGLASGMLLVPMAGMAIGLVRTSAHLFPSQAEIISAVVLGAVAVFETVGPPVAALAFRIAGEVNGGVKKAAGGSE